MQAVRHGSSRPRRALLCASLLTLALLMGVAGCADDDGEGDVRKPAPREPSSHKSPGDRAGSPPSASSSPGAGKDGEESGGEDSDKDGSGAAAAADGTDTGACEDAECEVELSAGDELHPRSSHGVDEFTVEKIEDHVITWTAAFSGGRVSMSAKGAQVSSTSCSNGSCGGRLGRTRGSLEMNGVTMEFTSIGEDSAVARISAEK
ncbi:hypothetical protein HCC61_19900 [Streptomyces sp. HNM0575]|uniref:hypothetical protein n=1 Tax=Streptomyces sp. HNM0575 TaxID=2716338 RepID=UPI00145DECFF|nr:hypothetical protein [Streptomyces sp. HNM0575]NLU74912.1 hypothetical protein [Streptomyces sp. HNM0575]